MPRRLSSTSTAKKKALKNIRISTKTDIRFQAKSSAVSAAANSNVASTPPAGIISHADLVAISCYIFAMAFCHQMFNGYLAYRYSLTIADGALICLGHICHFCVASTTAVII